MEFARIDAGWVRVRYHLDEDTDGLWLIREEFAWNAQDTGAQPLRHERLVRLTTGQFVFGLLDAQGHLTWSTSWDGTKQGIPRLIRFDCTLPAIGGRLPAALSRVVRNPAGSLPMLEENP